MSWRWDLSTIQSTDGFTARDRPALGFKTTNAKATAFQTPAPKKTAGPSPEKTQKRTVGRASRIQIHQEIKQAEAEPEIDWANEEIQYIPPRPTRESYDIRTGNGITEVLTMCAALPDVPSDDEWDKIDFSILRTGNFEGARQKALVARKAKREEEQYAEWDRQERERFAREDEEFTRTALDLLKDPEYDDDDEVAPKKVMPPPKPMARQMGTLKSREAAGALSQPKKTVPSYAAPTAATKAKVPMGSVLGHKKTPSLSASGNNARAASYQTLGYAKGRAVSNTIRPSSSTQNHEQVSQPAKPKRKDPLRELEELIEARDMEEAGILAKDLEDDIDGGVSLLEDDDEEEEVFQMKMPEA